MINIPEAAANMANVPGSISSLFDLRTMPPGAQQIFDDWVEG
jgi:hypothetical protein